MTFKLDQSASYFWNIKIEIPTGNGQTNIESFDAEFKRLPESKIQEVRRKVRAGETTDVEFANEVLVGWRGVSDENGEVKFSETAKARMFDIANVPAQIVSHYFDSILGIKRKNL